MSFIKTFIASGAIAHRRLVAFTGTDGQLVQGSGTAGERLAGVVDCPGGVTDGQRFDVVLSGPADIECGGNILPGQFFVSDPQGRAVAAAPAAGANAAIGGHLLTNAASGDIAKAFVNRSQIQG